jgi:hypothetical protein
MNEIKEENMTQVHKKMEKDKISLHRVESNKTRLVVNKDCFIKIF